MVVEPKFPLPKTCDWVTSREEPLIVLPRERDRAQRAQDSRNARCPLQSAMTESNRAAGSPTNVFSGTATFTRKTVTNSNSLEAIAVLVDYKLGDLFCPTGHRPGPKAWKDCVKISSATVISRTACRHRVAWCVGPHPPGPGSARGSPHSWPRRLRVISTASRQTLAIKPPSTRNTEPVRYDARVLAKKAIMSPYSSGRP